MKRVTKPTVDIASILQKRKKQRLSKFLLQWTLFVGLLASLIYGGFQFALPWHWQLFFRWLVRGGDVRTIPSSVQRELSILCYTAARNGHVDGYQASPQISYSLGMFQCLPSKYEDSWIIHDIYGFDSTREAMKGTPIAAILIKLVGQDYTFQIDAAIPKKISQN